MELVIVWYRKLSGLSGRASDLCVVPFGIFCRQFGKRAEDWRDPAGRRDQSKFNPGPVQVVGTRSLKHEVAFIRDQRFEFAASHSNIFICTLPCVALCFVILINCYTSQEDFNVFVNSVHQLDPIGVG